jgi:hypothetical protein
MQLHAQRQVAEHRSSRRQRRPEYGYMPAAADGRIEPAMPYINGKHSGVATFGMYRIVDEGPSESPMHEGESAPLKYT